MLTYADVYRWGRDYSSLTHRSIIEAFKGLEEGDMLDAVSAGTQFNCFTGTKVQIPLYH
jgi:hypothetical protein